jgi:hypothetical protein
MSSTSQTRRKQAAPATPGGSAGDVSEGASLLTSGLSHRKLDDVYDELLGKLEGNMVTNREQFIDDYVATMVKHDEMTTLWTDPAFYQQLKEAIREELLPIYDRYQDLRVKEERKLESNTWSRYCLWGVGICILLEAILTEGRGLRPPLLALGAVIGGLLGWGVWRILNARTLQSISRLERGFVQSIKDLIRKQEVSENYETFREYTGGELLKAELQELLSHSPNPQEFWRDYREVRLADPTSVEALHQLNKPWFNGFLQLHTQGTYSQEAREQRFNALFLLAHKAFLLADRKNYVQHHLTNLKD